MDAVDEKAFRLARLAELAPLSEEERAELATAVQRRRAVMKDHPWTGEVLLGITHQGGGLMVELGHGRWAAACTAGDCCASVWFESVGTEPLGGVILGVERREWRTMEPGEYEDGDVEEVAFWSIVTTKGQLGIETRLSHNGYYGGDVVWSIPTDGDTSKWWEQGWYDIQAGTPKRGEMPEGYNA